MEEEWRDICGYEGKYQVSSLGRVKSLDYNNTGEERILRPCKHNKGYLMIDLYKNSKGKTFKIHRLVAAAFIPNPENKPCIDHVNTARDDNRVDNLIWCTAKENNNNVLTISKKYGANNYRARKVLQFTREGVFVRKFDSMMDIQRELGFNYRNVSSCCLGKRKTCGGYIWKYA